MQASAPAKDILGRIVEAKKAEVAALAPLRRELRDRARAQPPARALGTALARDAIVTVVAEVKRRSPGAGAIRSGLDPGRLARDYAGTGAAALSVLTDEPRFGGSLRDLEAARAAVSIPVLRKDFTIDAIQVDEARAAGADAILLIVRILDDAQLVDLHGRATELGMGVLVEAHDAEEVERALAAGAGILGINNRDLRTFGTDLRVTEGLVGTVPAGCVVVSESGIGSGDDVARLGAAGVDAVLVGESLLRAPQPGERLRELVGHPKRGRGRV